MATTPVPDVVPGDGLKRSVRLAVSVADTDPLADVLLLPFVMVLSVVNVSVPL